MPVALLSLTLLLALPAGASRADETDEVPLVGRPGDLPFSGASAGFVVAPGPEYRVPFTLETTASRSEVEELAPVRFRVLVRAAGSVRHPPVRLDLRQVPAFARSFHIEDATDRVADSSGAETGTWRWTYRLKPRSTAIDHIPGVPFVFYNPDLRPAEKGFQVIWSDPLPLRVVTAERLAPPVEVPDFVLEIAPGAVVLAARGAWTGPGRAQAAAAVVVPPLVCVGWFLVWRRLYPDAARQAQRRRSRAARRALHALARAGRHPGRRRAEDVALALAGYLRERFDLHSAEPTPAEVAAWLRSAELTVELVAQGEGLLAACAAGRFQPVEDVGEEVVGRAGAWVMAVEEATWQRSS